MSTAVSISITPQIPGSNVREYSDWLSVLEEYNRTLSRLAEEARTNGVWIESYTPHISATSSWLSVLEDRIRRSVIPDEYEGEPSTEWISENAANAAIAFFRAGADLLPAEPHIYATRAGDLVAEFESSNGNLTSIVSDTETILFAVLSATPTEPLQHVIRKGSNSLRKEIWSFTKKLMPGSHGKMAAAK